MEQELTVRAIMLFVVLVALGILLLTDENTRKHLGGIFKPKKQEIIIKKKERP